MKTIKINLSDDDTRAITRLAATHGLTISELMREAVKSLINGDETAQAWLDHCRTGNTFIAYLARFDGGLQDFYLCGQMLRDANEAGDTDEAAHQRGMMQADYRDYVQWCRRQGCEPVTFDAAEAAVQDYMAKT